LFFASSLVKLCLGMFFQPMKRWCAMRVLKISLVICVIFLSNACSKEESPPPATPTPASAAATEAVSAESPTATHTPSPTAEPEAAVSDAYPAPVESMATTTVPAEPESYPPPDPASNGDSYPAPVPTATVTTNFSGPIVPFTLEKPLAAGATTVRGTGPAGVPIVIANVTFMGEVLGQGVIGEDGGFEISVAPLEEGHRLGIAIGELAATPWTYADFYVEGFRGDNAMQVPQVGFLFDSALVTAVE
jgi:hypothetical protein